MKVKDVIFGVAIIYLYVHCECLGMALDVNHERTDELKTTYCKYQSEGSISDYKLKINGLYNNSTITIEKGELDLEGTKKIKQRLDLQLGYNYFRQGFTRNRYRANASLLGMIKPEIKIKQGFVVSEIRRIETKVLCFTGINIQFDLMGQGIALSYEIMTDFDEIDDKYVKLEITRQMSSKLALGYSIDKRWEEKKRTIKKVFLRLIW
jgi:hypothetical protein